jgi:glycosyltransferase involved in cell wall biosynthesis
MTSVPLFEIVTASHSDAILDANLRRSPLLSHVPLHIERNAPSASIAYNRGLDATTAPYVVFAHHDVFLPRGWDDLLEIRLAELTLQDSTWALFGSFGVTPNGAYIGPVWSSSLGQIVGRVPMDAEPVQSFDELLIVMRRDAGLRWDEGLPGWHMYGTDIVATARAAGRTAYAGALPCIHNDGFHATLGPDYTECYRYMQHKWREQLPLRTPITKISRSGLHLWRDLRAAAKAAPFRERMAVSTGHGPEVLADRCGWTGV